MDPQRIRGRANDERIKRKAVRRYQSLHLKNKALQIYQLYMKPRGTRRSWCWCGMKSRAPCKCTPQVRNEKQKHDYIENLDLY